jgi:hypothetical protein
MLDATQRFLAVDLPNPKGGAGEGVWPVLLPPGTKVLVFGAVHERLLQNLRAHVGPVCEVSDHVRLEDAGADTRLLVLAPDRRFPRSDLARAVGEDGRVLRLSSARDGRGEPTEVRADPELRIAFRKQRVVQALPAAAASEARKRDRHRGRRRAREAYATLHAPTGDATRVPKHVEAAVAEAGGDIAGYVLSIRDEGNYRTKKVVMRLSPRTPGRPPLVLKVVRDPIDNHRLENEAHVLRRLESIAEVSPALPRVHAAGVLRDRAFVLQSLAPDRELSHLAPREASVAVDALTGWVIALSRATAHHDPVGTGADPLGELVRRFEASFRSPPRVSRRLRDDVGELSDSLPLVVMHGDLGLWNVRFGENGRPHLLDWEAGELDGPPLWDLFYLFRSLAARRTPGRDPVRAVERHLFSRSPLSDLQARAIDHGLRASGCPPRLVPALYRLCWVHRAVKESTRPRRWGRVGRFARLAQHVAEMDPARLHDALMARHREEDRCVS